MFCLCGFLKESCVSVLRWIAHPKPFWEFDFHRIDAIDCANIVLPKR